MKSYQSEVPEDKVKQTSGLRSGRDAAAAAVKGGGEVAGISAHSLDGLTSGKLAPTADSLLRLQQSCGNQSVLRALAVARKADHDADVAPDVERTIETARGGGQPLDSTVRSQIGGAFNADFSGVRVHHDARSDSLNQSLSAKAFTTGQDIFFRQGEYNPGSSSGRELLAHELTHVVQQNGDKIQGKYKDEEVTPCCSGNSSMGLQAKFTLGQPGDVFEQEADRMAQRYSRWENQGAGVAESTGGVHRQAEEEEKDKPVMAKHSGGLAQCQPEMAPEEKKEDEGPQTKLKTDGLLRQSVEDEKKKD